MMSKQAKPLTTSIKGAREDAVGMDGMDEALSSAAAQGKAMLLLKRKVGDCALLLLFACPSPQTRARNSGFPLNHELQAERKLKAGHR